MRFSILSLMTNATCQNDCRNCCTSALRKFDSTYELTLEQLNVFLYSTKKNGYSFNRIWLNGPGEPTSWKFFEAGLKELYKAKIADEIGIATNGENLCRISDDILQIASVRISRYPHHTTKQIKEQENFRIKFPARVSIMQWSQFFTVPKDIHSAIPCRCLCPGPMLYGDYVFPWCNPAVFTAAKSLSANLLTKPPEEMYRDANSAYLRGVIEKGPRAFYLCRFCYSNSNFKREFIKHRKFNA